jgi:hypothetical protein
MPLTAKIGEAKTRLSELIVKVEAGEEVVIACGRSRWRGSCASRIQRIWRDNLNEKRATIRMRDFGRGGEMIVAERQ